MEQSGHVDIDTHHLMSFLVFAAFGSSSCVAVSSLLEQALVFCFNSACIFAIESPIRKKFAIHELVGARKIIKDVRS